MKSAMILAASMWAAAGSGELLAQPRTEMHPPPGYIAIVGEKNPELIPQWMLWREVFRTWATEVRNMPEMFMDTLPADMSPDEIEVIRKESLLQAERDEQLWTQLEELDKAAKLSGEGQAVTLRKSNETERTWRWTVLAARDRVLEALRPDMQIALVRYVDLRRKNMAAIIPADDMENFRQPQ